MYKRLPEGQRVDRLESAKQGFYMAFARFWAKSLENHGILLSTQIYRANLEAETSKGCFFAVFPISIAPKCLITRIQM